MDELGGQLPTQFWADQLTFYQPEGENCANPPSLLLAHDSNTGCGVFKWWVQK